MRYEIRDISPPPGVRAAMELQAEAERRKRAQILESEGTSQAKVNVAEAAKKEQILFAEGKQAEEVLVAKGNFHEISPKMLCLISEPQSCFLMQ